VIFSEFVSEVRSVILRPSDWRGRRQAVADERDSHDRAALDEHYSATEGRCLSDLSRSAHSDDPLA
jgi:hypothetical protein